MGSEINENVRQANAQVGEWASDCNKTVSCPTLERYIEIEIEVVTKKYDKFGRVLEETIEKLKVKLREVRQKEVCTVYSFSRGLTVTRLAEPQYFNAFFISFAHIFGVFSMNENEIQTFIFCSGVSESAPTQKKVGAGKKCVPFPAVTHSDSDRRVGFTQRRLKTSTTSNSSSSMVR